MSQPTSHRGDERELRRLNRALRMLSDSNQSLIRITDEAQLLHEVCRIAVEVGGYRMAWVGFPENDERKTVRVAAVVGFDQGYLESMGIVWADEPHGHGPSGTAIRTGQVRIVGRISDNRSTVQWREAARERGYESVAALPLLNGAQAFGALSVYAGEPDAFDDEEIKILAELAGDLAFGLGALRARAEQARAEERLHKSDEVFRAIVENSPDLILRFDREYREIYVNPAVCRMFGLPAEAFLNKPIGAATLTAGHARHAAGLALVRQSIDSVFASGEPCEVEVHWPTPQGDRTFGLRYFPERDRAGAIVSVLAVARDITDRRHAEESLQNVLRHARSMVMHAVVTAPAGWEQHDVAWAAANFRWESRFEDEAAAQAVLPIALAPGEHYIKGWNRAKHPDDWAPMGAISHAAFLSGAASWSQEFRAIDQFGQLHWFSQVALVESPVRGRWRVTTVNTDITALKQAEREQAAHLRFFENLDRVNRVIQAATTAEQMMSEALGALLEIFQCDRAWLSYPCDPAAATWRVPMERTRPEYPGALALGLEVPMDANVADVLTALIAAGRPVKFGPGFEQPVPALIAEKFSVKSFIAMPLFPRGDRPYAFGLHQCSHLRDWSAEDEKLFREIGHRLADGLTGLLARRDQHESEAKFRTLAENTPDFIVRWDRDLRRIYVNPAFAVAMGVTPSQLTGGGADESEVAPVPAAIELLVTTIREVFAHGRPAEILMPWTTIAGESFHYVRFIPEPGVDGKIATVLGIGRDVTALKETEEQLRALTDNSPDLIARVDRAYRYVYVNRAIERLTGIPAEQHLGRPLGAVSLAPGELMPDESIRNVHAAIDRVFATGLPTEIEGRMRLPRRDLVLDGRFVPEFNQRGEVATVLVIARDVTERAAAAEALRQSQQAYASLVTTIDGIVWEADAQTFQFTFVSPQAERILGYPAAQWMSEASFWSEHLHPEDRQQAVDYCVAATREMRDHNFRYRMIAADGRAVWLHDLVTVVAEGGRPVKLRGIMLDITKAKSAEEALVLFRALIDHTTDSIEVIDPLTGRFLDVNETACRTHGYTREEFLALSVPDLEVALDLRTPDRWRRNIEEIRRAGNKIIEGAHRRKDGSTFPIEINANYVRLDRDYLVSIVRDVTDRKRAESALRESELRFRQVTETIDEVFWLTDATKQEMIYISPAYEKIWGRTCASLYAFPHSWLDSIHPEDRERVRAALGTQLAGSYDVEYRIVRPDREERWIHDRAFPIKDADGRVGRVAGVAEDITQARQLEAQFRQSQKMDAIGQLAGGVAHDFNNLLTVIQLQTSMLLADHSLGIGVEQSVRQIKEAATRAANLTRQLLTFSRQTTKQARALDVGEVVTSTTKLLRRVLGEDISLETRFASGLPLVHADPGMMEQVLMNLVINARDAMPGGGRLTLALDAVELDAEYVAAHTSARPGRFVCLSVNDTGAGIPPEILPRIFEPFFTTKEVGKGTGLGLATVYGILQQHHGWIEAESEVGRGSHFRVFLPTLQKIPADETQPAPTLAPGGTERVLLVEDETVVRLVAAEALRRRGYAVFEASNAADAVRCWEHEHGKFDLLLTDLIMPGGVSGQSLADELRRRRSDLKVIFTSGYSDEVVTRELRLVPGRNFLPKPYPIEELLAIVRQRLDGE